MAIVESPKTPGTWWVTSPSRPGEKVCLRRRLHDRGPWFVWAVSDKFTGRYAGMDILDAFAVAEKMLEELPSDGN